MDAAETQDVLDLSEWDILPAGERRTVQVNKGEIGRPYGLPFCVTTAAGVVTWYAELRVEGPSRLVRYDARGDAPAVARLETRALLYGRRCASRK